VDLHSRCARYHACPHVHVLTGAGMLPKLHASAFGCTVHCLLTQVTPPGGVSNLSAINVAGTVAHTDGIGFVWSTYLNFT
jgi:hypothetical protein